MSRVDEPTIVNDLSHFQIASAKDVFEKLEHFSVDDKHKIVEVINIYMRTNRVARPTIRIHNEQIASLKVQNHIPSTLTMHYADIFVVDFPHENIKDEISLMSLMNICLPRLIEKGLIILKHHEGVRVLKKNVTYGLKSQLFSAA